MSVEARLGYITHVSDEQEAQGPCCAAYLLTAGLCKKTTLHPSMVCIPQKMIVTYNSNSEEKCIKRPRNGFDMLKVKYPHAFHIHLQDSNFHLCRPMKKNVFREIENFSSALCCWTAELLSSSGCPSSFSPSSPGRHP